MATKRESVVPTSRQLRLAVGHLIELAVAYEKNGVGRHDDPAVETLSRCVASLLAHREQLGKVRKRVATATLAEDVAAVYRKYQSDAGITEGTYRALLDRCLRRFSWSLPVDTERSFALEILVASKQDIRNSRGPVECAANRVAQIFGITERSIFNRKSDRAARRLWVLPPRGKPGKIVEVPVPTAFGTYVTFAAMETYAKAALKERNIPPPELGRNPSSRVRLHAPKPG